MITMARSHVIIVGMRASVAVAKLSAEALSHSDNHVILLFRYLLHKD